MFKLNKIVTAIFALTALVSCVEMEDPHDGQVGYLAAPSLDVDVTVDNLLLTKAAPALPSVQAPDAEMLAEKAIKKKAGEDAAFDMMKNDFAGYTVKHDKSTKTRIESSGQKIEMLGRYEDMYC